jgi:hypothetical protein
MHGWDWYSSTKSVLGHIMLNLWFCIRWELWVT